MYVSEPQKEQCCNYKIHIITTKLKTMLVKLGNGREAGEFGGEELTPMMGLVLEHWLKLNYE